MCNQIHKEHETIKKTGFGWKLFTVRGGKFYPLCKQGYFTAPTKEWVIWKKDNVNTCPEDAGFCFFLNKKTAERAKNAWGWGSLRKIVYREGICKQNERRFISGHSFRTALCKEFKIIKKGEENDQKEK